MLAVLDQCMRQEQVAEETAKQDQVVYLALPRRPQRIVKDEKKGEIKAVKPVRRGRFKMGRAAGSLLNFNFNRLWVNALNARSRESITHFAMQHDDIVPAAGWCDVLIDEMERTGADIISAVVPIKDDRGVTTTGVRNWVNGSVRRLTMTEVFDLPETFDLDDLPSTDERGDEILVLNTGLWVCRFDGDWPEKFPGFRSIDAIRRGDDGMFQAATLSEDWCFSEWASRRGLKLMATRKVALAHVDDDGNEYRNNHVWGTCKTDPGDGPKC